MTDSSHNQLSRIGILGGTFDPIHKGHLLLASEAKKQFNLERVFFIPTYQTPIKDRLLTPAPIRLEMIKRAVRELKGFEALDWEIKRQGISYSIDTVKMVKESFPQSEIFFIMGSDSFLSLPQWKHPEEIAELVTFLVAVRGQHEKQVLESPFYPKTKRLRTPLYPISSSLVRERISRKINVEDLLTAPVLAYIQEKSLYQA